VCTGAVVLFPTSGSNFFNPRYLFFPKNCPVLLPSKKVQFDAFTTQCNTDVKGNLLCILYVFIPSCIVIVCIKSRHILQRLFRFVSRITVENIFIPTSNFQ
jgi:hypothetical protein